MHTLGELLTLTVLGIALVGLFVVGSVLPLVHILRTQREKNCPEVQRLNSLERG
jgi:hypothetical protein